ncbi:JAB domain-containing protein [Aestuariicella hydrocarbonica]|uniref:JAB domain-containing protein n=1 Tax=Pseudomaricurvus hydrocarbonicus TaxID=1470433 RepID=A0A9E5MPG3_9GAMM|nr:DNA repair protein RadC [Aestuariicella hydrocarbonica]NHO67975.1 JAB domain-containing protein [Aestuariicella hydrocarbonica]
MSIRHWPATERPREKLLSRGAGSLSDAELLAIFLRTGCAGKSAVDLARDLLTSFGGLRQILESDRQSFCAAHGLGDAKFSQLQAVLEMGRRHLSSVMEQAPGFENPQMVKDYLRAELRHRPREIFSVLLLDNQHRLLGYHELFQGTIDAASVYPREVVKLALAHNAAAVILAHNHPSGVAEPSQADKRITERLQQALGLVDIRVLDHMVVGEAQVLSFAERGLL